MSTTPGHGHIPPAQQMHPQQPEHNPEEEEEEEDGEEIANRFLFFNVMPSWMVSFVTHVGLIILLALLWLPRPQKEVIGLEGGDSPNDTIEEVETEFEDEIDLESDVLETVDSSALSELTEENLSEPETLAVEEIQDFGEILAGDESNFESELFNESAFSGSEVSGRSADARPAQLRKKGGTAGSEKAVERALEWLARHQLPDGGWSLDHTVGPGKDRDKNDPGDKKGEARNGATALALLPFLGHGDTHLEGDYQETVRNGLNFLMKRGVADGRGIRWHDPRGSMYSHGLVSIVFNEAYAMTGDSELAPFAQGSIWYIEDVQDPTGGGWRYAPRQAGDTSAVGWQLMAIKSAKISGLDYNKKTVKLAEKFLDSVSIDYGAWYGYTDKPTRKKDGSYSTRRKGCAAVGLLCRMYLGWDREHQGLGDGVDFISKIGPSVTSEKKTSVDMYYNYYATQIMLHYGGQEWKEWNGVMRDFLVDSQETEGTKKGSWHWSSRTHASKVGGRLYETALAAMTLEVYYRFLPLYKDSAAEDEFPLD